MYAKRLLYEAFTWSFLTVLSYTSGHYPEFHSQTSVITLCSILTYRIETLLISWKHNSFVLWQKLSVILTHKPKLSRRGHQSEIYQIKESRMVKSIILTGHFAPGSTFSYVECSSVVMLNDGFLLQKNINRHECVVYFRYQCKITYVIWNCVNFFN